MHTHHAHISNEYARIKLEEIRLLKARALLEGFDHQRINFLPNISNDYEAMVKDEEDLFEDLSEES
jgi:hypothetical protein